MKSAYWFEDEVAAQLSDVLGLLNIAEPYARARTLFADALGVQCVFTPMLLCMALDILAENHLDGYEDEDEQISSHLLLLPQQESALEWLRAKPERQLDLCTFVYEHLALAVDRGISDDTIASLDADFFEKSRFYIPEVELPSSCPAHNWIPDDLSSTFAVTEDVYWLATTDDELQLAQYCHLHALSAHYPAKLRDFFVKTLNVPVRPKPSTSRLLETMHQLSAMGGPITESLRRTITECHRLLAERDLSGLEEEMAMTVGDVYAGCPLHGPSCQHPACRALGSLFGRRMAAGAGPSMHQLGLVGGDVHECFSQAQQTIERALRGCRRHQRPELTSADDQVDGVSQECEQCEEVPHPCTRQHNLQQVGTTSHGLPVFVDRSLLHSHGTGQLLAHVAELSEAFGQVLLFVTSLTSPGMPLPIHLFYELPRFGQGQILAFNQDGALFFSIHAFKDRHAASPWHPTCTSFWLITLAHEVAHNEVSEAQRSCTTPPLRHPPAHVPTGRSSQHAT